MRISSFPGNHHRSGLAHPLWVCLPAIWLMPVVAVQAQESTVSAVLEMPTAANETVIWAVKSRNVIVHVDRLRTGEQRVVRLTVDNRDGKIPDGPTMLLVCINRDRLDSFYPSVGDYYLTAETLVSRRNGAFGNLRRVDWAIKEASDEANVLTIHYLRKNVDYNNVTLWTWDSQRRRTPDNPEIYPVGRDNDGLIFQLDVDDYGTMNEEEKIGLRPVLYGAGAVQDGMERIWSTSLGMNVFIVQEDAKVYSEMPEAPKPEIEEPVVPEPEEPVPAEEEKHVTFGAVYSAAGTTFRVFVPGADSVELVLADQPTGGETERKENLRQTEDGIWEARAEGDLAGKFYAYRIHGPGHDPKVEVTDPYAICASGRGARCLIVDPAQTNPPGFVAGFGLALGDLTNAIIYELNVRDFTGSGTSGVRQKGTYLGLTERGTTLPGSRATKTALDHLVELGITHVQLMPVQDFDNDESDRDAYDWGYMPVHHNSPEGVYASEMVGPKRIIELKRLVQALHERGIGVIMDAVYNHTAAGAPAARLAPDYYFRKTEDGSFYDGSNCGNEFKSESRFGRQFIRDSLAYWVSEYGIDGFRLDQMGLIDVDTLTRVKADLDEIRPSILLYGEPWAAGRAGLVPITDKTVLAGTGIGAFNDVFRDAIRGSPRGSDGGYVQTGLNLREVAIGLGGSVKGWAADPFESINYVECHDDLTLWDKLIRSMPTASDEDRKRRAKFAAAILLTAQGIPMIHSGQEFCRTKGGTEDSMHEGAEANLLDWTQKEKNRDVFEYYKNLSALRKQHVAFRLSGATGIRGRLQYLTKAPSPECTATSINCLRLQAEPWNTVRVYYNGSEKDRTFGLTGEGWQVYADEKQASTEPFREARKRIAVRRHSVLIIAK